MGAVTPFIVAAGWDEASASLVVSANVPQIVESDGTCTITASSGGASVSGSFPATPSAAATDCGTQSLSGDFTSGDWTVTVSYSSPLSSGSTQYVETVSVP